MRKEFGEAESLLIQVIDRVGGPGPDRFKVGNHAKFVLTQRLNAAEPQPNGNAFNAEDAESRKAFALTTD